MEAIIARVAKLLDVEVQVLEYVATPFLLFVRLYWGYAFAVDGWGKLHNLDKVTEFFAGLGIPAPGPNALMVALTQLVCGTLMFFGIASRVISIPLVVCMTMAYLTSDINGLRSLWLSADACQASPNCIPFEEATPFSFWMAAWIVLLWGPGMISVDELIKRAWKARAAPQPSPRPASA